MRKAIAILFSFALISAPALADKHEKKTELTAEQRENIAKSHEAMAKCVREGKDMHECHETMHKNCEAMGDKCPMHYKGEHGKMHGKGHGKMHGKMHGKAKSQEKSADKAADKSQDHSGH